MHISVVSPVYLGEHVVVPLVERLTRTLTPITSSYEIILVDDGSTDHSWQVISKLCDNNFVKGVRLNKNYGQHPAIQTGLTYAKGEWIVVMDCDLQDPPEEIPGLYAKTGEGFDAIFALRNKQWQPVMKKILSFLFYQTLSLFSGYRFDMRTTNFGIYHHAVVKNALQVDEKYFLFPLAMRKFSKRRIYVNVRFDPAPLRKTSYTFRRAVQLAWTIIISQTFLYRRHSKPSPDDIISEVKS